MALDRRTKTVGILGFAICVCAVVGLTAAVVIVVRDDGENMRLIGLLGFPVGVGFIWFLFRGPGRQLEPWRHMPNPVILGVAIVTAVGTAGVFSDVLGLFALTFLLGMITPPLIVILDQMANASRASRH